MDARVNDFLNEINEIAPLSEPKEDCVWEKCHDEESGYYYYWNTKTNEVTWDMPSEYKPKNKTKKPVNLYIPPRTAPLFPSTSGLLPPVSDAIKIYKIGECADKVSSSTNRSKPKAVEKDPISNRKEEKKKVVRPKQRRSSSDEDEKIVLISSYSGGSDSDEEKEPSCDNKVVNGSNDTPRPSSRNSDEDDEVDILTTIQKRAKELKELGGELPAGVIKIVNKPEPSPNKGADKEIVGFSLVAGYSDSEDEADSETKTVSPLNKVSHSTLFPITKPINVKDFENTVVEPSVERNEQGDFDSKAFQRKRRIGVALVNTGRKPAIDAPSDAGEERKGLGFAEDSGSVSTYPGFKSGGVMFVKSDVLNPPVNSGDGGDKILKSIEDTYVNLKEKLGFLSEGKDPVSPVQAMLIQIETLYSALKAGDLKQSYLRNWLNDTCADLIKLEKETTPEGWLLQWDRSHKRYYYQNEATGENQWEYPQADVTRCDEAMDISTTPPHCGAEQSIHMSPPQPPIIGSPSPPPAPTISNCLKSAKKKKCDIPLPPEPTERSVTSEKYDSNGEPLPPGVDLQDVVVQKSKDSAKRTNDLSDALSSFYSDIAAIETSNSPPASSTNEDVKVESLLESLEPAKKKKKTKVKLAQGIAMKKRGVSKLVEKWKNVQLSYND